MKFNKMLQPRLEHKCSRLKIALKNEMRKCAWPGFEHRKQRSKKRRKLNSQTSLARIRTQVSMVTRGAQN